MMWGSLFRSLDAAVCFNIIAMLRIYMPAIVGVGMGDRDVFARNLILGICTGWTGALIFFANLTIKYWGGFADPTVSIADTPVRLIYLSFILLGTSMHIATALRGRFGGWYYVLSWWVFGVVSLVLALLACDQYLLPLVMEWRLP